MSRLFLATLTGVVFAAATYLVYFIKEETVTRETLIQTPMPTPATQSAPIPHSVAAVNAITVHSSSSQQSSAPLANKPETNEPAADQIVAQPDRPGATIDRNRAAADAQAAARAYYQEHNH